MRNEPSGLRKKILYISYDGMTDPLGQSQVLPYLVGLSKLGYQFTILSFEKPARFKQDQHLIGTITKEAGIIWVPLSFTSNPPVISKFYDTIRMRLKAFQLQRDGKFDMVHCRSYIAADIGLRMKKKFGTKFFFDMRGFWADEKVDGGQWKLNSPLWKRVYRYYKTKEKRFLLEADAIVSLTEAARRELCRQEAYSKLAIDVIPCCADLRHFDFARIGQEERQALRRQFTIPPGAKVISYLGSIGGWYMTKEMFVFVAGLMKNDNSFRMLVLTKDDPAIVRAEAVREGIPDESLIITYAGRKELPSFLSLSDVSIFFIRPTYSKIASSPTKHAELMGMGIPVICNPIGDTGLIVEENGTGLLVNDFTTRCYTEIQKQLPQLLETDPVQIRKAAFRYFDLEKGIEHYGNIYKRILDVPL